MAEVGRNDCSAFSQLTTRDHVRDLALEPAHTFARLIGRVMGVITQSRSEALVSSLSKMDPKGKATRISLASAPAQVRSKKKTPGSAAPTTHEY